MSWPSYSAFIRDRTIQHSALVVPVMVMWRDYKAYCTAWGFEPATATEFMAWLHTLEDVEIKEGGTGRRHRYIEGIGLRPAAQLTDKRVG